MAEARPSYPEPSDGLAVYVHWPFCLAKCPYCDFNSHVRDDVNDLRWRRALCAEINHVAVEAGKRTVGSIFFGGGTPSLMAPETVAAVIDQVGQVWNLAADAEITLEANPTSVEAGRFAAYRAAGEAEEPAAPRTINPAIPPDLEVVIATAMDKNRDRRYQTAEDLAEELRRVREHEPIQARPASTVTRLLRWAQRHPARATATAPAPPARGPAGRPASRRA